MPKAQPEGSEPQIPLTCSSVSLRQRQRQVDAGARCALTLAVKKGEGELKDSAAGCDAVRVPNESRFILVDQSRRPDPTIKFRDLHQGFRRHPALFCELKRLFANLKTPATSHSTSAGGGANMQGNGTIAFEMQSWPTWNSRRGLQGKEIQAGGPRSSL